MDICCVSKLLPRIAEAEINVIPNPLINIVLQGRHDKFPKGRDLTRVREMLAMGINVGWGQDCVPDPGTRSALLTCWMWRSRGVMWRR